MKRFLKRYFDFSRSWSAGPRYRLCFRPWAAFYCYLLPQRCPHSSPLKPGVWVTTQVDYFWLNMVLHVYHTRPMNDAS